MSVKFSIRRDREAGKGVVHYVIPCGLVYGAPMEG
jgi:hypothetical protein